MKIWIVIVNWNQPILTELCIESLLKQENIYDLHIVVVDNGSTDTSVEYLQEQFNRITLLKSKENLGFSKGYNLGIKYSLQHGASSVLILNNDTWAAPDLVAQLVSAAELNHADICAPIIFFEGTENKIWSAGGNISPITMIPFDAHHRKDPIPIIPTKKEFLSGCALLIKSEVFNQIGFFDEDFFLYYEYMDYCVRAKKQQLNLLLVPQARLWHRGSASSKNRGSYLLNYWVGYSRIQFFRKHLSGWQWFFVAPMLTFTILKNVLLLLFHGNVDASRVYLKAVADALQ